MFAKTPEAIELLARFHAFHGGKRNMKRAMNALEKFVAEKNYSCASAMLAKGVHIFRKVRQK